MSVILILILASLGVALAFLGSFVWAVRSGQFEDTCTPAMRILAGDDSNPAREKDATLPPPNPLIRQSTNPSLHPIPSAIQNEHCNLRKL
jgi:cbb3-type cytochrome oxidase maturation protein